MARYSYACDLHGVFDAVWPIGTAPGELACGDCDLPARKVLTAPRLLSSRRSVDAALDAHGRSREAPVVVRREAADRSANPFTHPAQTRLPRP